MNNYCFSTKIHVIASKKCASYLHLYNLTIKMPFVFLKCAADKRKHFFFPSGFDLIMVILC